MGFQRLQIQMDRKNKNHTKNLVEKMGKLHLQPVICGQDEGQRLMMAFVKVEICLWNHLTFEEKRIFLSAKHSFMVDFDGSILIKPGKTQ